MPNDIYIYTKDTGFDYQQRSRLNRMAREVFDFFVRYFQAAQSENAISALFASRFPYAGDIEQIIITSQDRSNGTHQNGNAVDIGVIPMQLMPIFWIIFHRFTTWNVFLSAHNRHIHIDSDYRNNRKNLKKIEAKTRANPARYSVEPPQAQHLTFGPMYYDDEYLEYVVPDVTNPLRPTHRTERRLVHNLLNRSINEMYRCEGVSFIGSHFTEIIPENQKLSFPDDERRGGIGVLSVVGITLAAITALKILLQGNNHE